jgi:hypothetical protein
MSPSGQTKDYNVGIGCFSAAHAALRSQSKDWLSRNQVTYFRVREWVIVVKRPMTNFRAILYAITNYIQWNGNDARFVLEHASLDLYSTSSQKQPFMCRHVISRWHIILVPRQLIFAQQYLWRMFKMCCWLMCWRIYAIKGNISIQF